MVKGLNDQLLEEIIDNYGQNIIAISHMFKVKNEYNAFYGWLTDCITDAGIIAYGKESTNEQRAEAFRKLGILVGAVHKLNDFSELATFQN